MWAAAAVPVMPGSVASVCPLVATAALAWALVAAAAAAAAAGTEVSDSVTTDAVQLPDLAAAGRRHWANKTDRVASEALVTPLLVAALALLVVTTLLELVGYRAQGLCRDRGPEVARTRPPAAPAAEFRMHSG